MSLVDTWAAAGAGAYTLSENGLYTVDAWQIFLDHLKPGGLFGASRWFAPSAVSETSRLLSLAVAALLERGVAQPAEHIALVARGRIATLLVGADPLSERDRARLAEVADRYDFTVLVAPGELPSGGRLERIVASRSRAELRTAVADADYDFSPPDDERPYFFNMLKPLRVLRLLHIPRREVRLGGGVIWGNIRATGTLIALLFIAMALVVAIVFLPLAMWGFPAMGARSFAVALGYFALIGYGFMSVQLPLLQRFSPFLGHPIYAYAIILATMISAAGLGSILSERLALSADLPWHWAIPCAIAALLLFLRAGMGPLLAVTVKWGLLARCLVVVALTAPVSTLLGFCFPFGVRLVGPLAPDALPWMWGVNGATSVLASILAVAVSLWAGISVNLLIAAALYLLLALPARALGRAGAATAARSAQAG